MSLSLSLSLLFVHSAPPSRSLVLTCPRTLCFSCCLFFLHPLIFVRNLLPILSFCPFSSCESSYPLACIATNCRTRTKATVHITPFFTLL